MSETPVCEVCGRVPGRQPGGCEQDCASDTVNGYTGVVECLEFALDTARAALSAAEKREERLREALAKYWTGCRKCASWLGTDGPVTPAGSWFRGCDACRELREAYRATKAALELASAASARSAPKLPLDPPETA